VNLPTIELTIEAQLLQAEQQLSQTLFPKIEAICHQNTARVLNAFRLARIGEEHFACVTGYGHNDLGREALDVLFAHALQAETALVRPHIVSGTHAIALALNGCLSHGMMLLSLTGNPYDTLEEVIGIRGDSKQSLRAKGVSYHALDVFEGDEAGSIRTTFTAEEQGLIQQANMLYIQRSRGYSTRLPLTITQLETLIQAVKAFNPTAVIFVDNCYGEFMETQEPTAVGADLMAGSLIKNPGGGIALAGGYVAGRADLIESVAECLTCPGIGADGGYMFDQTRTLMQGLFLAPNVVKEAVKGMVLAAYLFEKHGLKASPAWDEPRADIIQTLFLQDAEQLKQFCATVQAFSPVSSYVTPIPANAPGYESELIMAGGTFIDGSSIELSADAPLRPPFCLYFQGGLVYSHTRLVVSQLLKHLMPLQPDSF
jgi:cystathionine beta-lyase family protein involved in aluminum resistance